MVSFNCTLILRILRYVFFLDCFTIFLITIWNFFSTTLFMYYINIYHFRCLKMIVCIIMKFLNFIKVLMIRKIFFIPWKSFRSRNIFRYIIICKIGIFWHFFKTIVSSFTSNFWFKWIIQSHKNHVP